MTRQFLRATVPWATTSDPTRLINVSNRRAWGVWLSLAASKSESLVTMQLNAALSLEQFAD
jgi:hypothetical protein